MNKTKQLLENVLERGITPVAGGHAVWSHTTLRISAIEGTGQVHRMWYIKRHGEIPHGKYLLNKCKVPGCIEPACHFLSPFATMRDVERSHAALSPQGPACEQSSPQEVRCDSRG